MGWANIQPEKAWQAKMHLISGMIMDSKHTILANKYFVKSLKVHNPANKYSVRPIKILARCLHPDC